MVARGAAEYPGKKSKVRSAFQVKFVRTVWGPMASNNESLTKQREVFINNRVFLVDFLDADDIIDDLIQEKMIGKNAAQKVQLQTTSREKNRIIVEQLANSGPETLEKFCRILRNTGRLAFIAEVLAPECK